VVVQTHAGSGRGAGVVDEGAVDVEKDHS
jgi:hypothetical protein